MLLVEDDPGDALIVRESFAQAGRNNRFHIVPDGQQALRLLRQAGEHAAAPRPGLIILDLNLPGLHGLDVRRRRGVPESVPVPAVRHAVPGLVSGKG